MGETLEEIEAQIREAEATIKLWDVKERLVGLKERRKRLGWKPPADPTRLQLSGAERAEYYSKALAAQGGACAICGYPASELRRRLSIDHDHRTGQVRGLLCTTCNLGLGAFRDDPAVLAKAIEYLGRDRG